MLGSFLRGLHSKLKSSVTCLVFGVRLAQQAQSVVKGGFGEACTASSKVKLGLLLKGCHASPCVWVSRDARAGCILELTDNQNDILKKMWLPEACSI